MNKTFARSEREHIVRQILLLILFAGVAALVCLADRAPIDLESIRPDLGISQKFVYYWQGVVYQFFPGPYVYRFLIPYSYSLLNSETHISLIALDLYMKMLMVLACQYALLRYLARFFDIQASLLGVFIFDALLGYLFSYIKGPSVIETIDLLNFLTITLGLGAIHAGAFFRFSLIMFVGLLNRETPLILLPIAAMHEWITFRQLKQTLIPVLLSGATFVAVHSLISSWAGTSWFNLDELRVNLAWPNANARLAVLLAPFILISLYRFREHPLFLRIAASAIPLLILIHYFVAWIIESRLWFPVFPFLIPLVVGGLAKMLPGRAQVGTGSQ